MVQTEKGNTSRHLLSLLLLSGLLFGGCKSNAPVLSASPDFPVFASGPALHVRASSRELTPHSAAVTVELVAIKVFLGVSVAVVSDNPALSVTPTACHFVALKPPAIEHAPRPPYPLPAIPLCTFIVTAHSPGRYRVRIHVEGANGITLVSPIVGAVKIKGEQP